MTDGALEPRVVPVNGLPARVVMCVGNDVRTDNRVRRSAQALAGAGADVTVVGYSPSGQREESRLGDVRVLLVPVPWTLRDARRDRRRNRRTRGLPLLGYPSREAEQAARARLAARTGEIRTDGLAAAWRRGALAARQLGVRSRGAVTWRFRNRQRAAWRRWDEWVGHRTLRVRWRSIVPEADDYERAFGPVIDALDPDVVHAHDVHMVGVADGIVRRAAARGRRIRWVYDAHEWVPGLSQYDQRTARVVAAWAALEGAYVRRADLVVTVSPQLAEALVARYALGRVPTVVLNVPEQVGRADLVGLREVLELAADLPLLVYSGGIQAARGVQTAVEALALLPDVHLALVSVPSKDTGAVRELTELARRCGVSERVHPLDPVAPQEISQFLASADVGLIPLLHFGSHEVALANKLFEYLHAQLPLVVSDCRAQADFVSQHHIGAVHRAGDPVDFARAVREVLAQRADLVRALSDPVLQRENSWPEQARQLVTAYADLLGGDPASGDLEDQDVAGS